MFSNCSSVSSFYLPTLLVKNSLIKKNSVGYILSSGLFMEFVALTRRLNKKYLIFCGLKEVINFWQSVLSINRNII